MKVVIIEDEQHTASDLAACIKKADPSAEIVASLSSVREATAFFSEGNDPDLIFSDIQLGDGLSFSVFDLTKNSIPVIFCTAYDEYALNAFKSAGIDYILKPFTSKSIAASLAKYKELKERLTRNSLSYGNFGELFQRGKKNEPKSVLVYHKEKITPVRIEDIALFYLQHDLTQLMTLDRQHYFINHTMEELEKMTAGDFYRANRQYLVNLNHIKKYVRGEGNYLVMSNDANIPVARNQRERLIEKFGWL